MCGLAGIFNLNNGQVHKEQLLYMGDCISHRGPDDSDILLDGPLGFIHRRLSILDLSPNGRQPMFSSDKRYSIIFNGEIFNFLELKKELEKDKIQFQSNSDTEVLLYLFIKHGPSMLEKLNGMFAFAIYDTYDRSLFICRDRLGVKPLYYSIQNDSLFFASEHKSLIVAGIDPETDEKALDEQLLFRFISGERTIFKNIKRLLPGHFMTVRNGEIKISRWWNLSEKIRNHEKIKDPYSWFEEKFHSAVQYRTISDVPVGVLLSGGVDSSSIAASLHLNHNSNRSAFTVTFEEDDYNEGNIAKEVAEKFGLEFNELRLTGSKLIQTLKDASYFSDEPLIHQNDAHLLAISTFAKDKVTVLLSGEGSDEIMGGYVRYKPLYQQALIPVLKILAPIAATLIKNPRFEKLHRYYNNGSVENLVYLNACTLYPKDYLKYGAEILDFNFSYRNQVLKEAKSIYPKEPVRQAMYLDQHTFLCSLLDRNDRTTMGASIECRTPFLDYRIVEGVASLPSKYLLSGKKGKHLLIKTMGKYLPDSVLKFKKWGFGVPWGKYLNQDAELKNIIMNMPSSQVFQKGIFAHMDLKKIVKEYYQGNSTHEPLLRQMLMIAIWDQTYLDRIKKKQFIA